MKVSRCDVLKRRNLVSNIEKFNSNFISRWHDGNCSAALTSEDNSEMLRCNNGWSYILFDVDR